MIISCSLPEYTSEVEPSILVISVIEPGKPIEGEFWWLSGVFSNSNENKEGLIPTIYRNGVQIYRGKKIDSVFNTTIVPEKGTVYEIELLTEGDTTVYRSSKIKALKTPTITSVIVDDSVKVDQYNENRYDQTVTFQVEKTVEMDPYFIYQIVWDSTYAYERDRDTFATMFWDPFQENTCSELGSAFAFPGEFRLLNLSCLEENKIVLNGQGDVREKRDLTFTICNIDEPTINLFRQMVYNISYDGAHYNPYFLAHLNLKDDFPRSGDNYEIILNTACVDTTLYF
ncbi:hypothetical protein [Portibacter marinus]|uniref:hypothetical protein n=1 Tax=Portibacter marinus TaxID=2898660 RepID=UPI001F2DC661|nr:hypothetical protein [Portibacter marinus]